MAWTDQMIADLKDMWAKGVTTGEIGKRLGVSKNSVVGKVHRLGLEGRPSPIKTKSANAVTKVEKKEVVKPEAKKVPAKAEKKEVAKPEIKKVPAPKEENTPVTKKEENTSVTKKEENTPVAKVEPKEIISEKQISQYMAPISNINKASKDGNTSLTDLDNHTCRWPIGDPKDENFHFCGKKVKIGQTYCEEHSAIAYVKAKK